MSTLKLETVVEHFGRKKTLQNRARMIERGADFWNLVQKEHLQWGGDVLSPIPGHTFSEALRNLQSIIEDPRAFIHEGQSGIQYEMWIYFMDRFCLEITER